MPVDIVASSWFSGAVIPDPKDPAKVLVFEYWGDYQNRPNQVGIKFPGGSKKNNADRNDSSPEDTLRREIEEEVFRNREGEVLEHELLCSDKTKPGHTKFFFRVTRFTGTLRQEDIFEEELGYQEQEQTQRGPARTERMGPPKFMNIKDLAEVIFPSHATALRAYCERVSVISPKVAFEALDVAGVLDERGL